MLRRRTFWVGLVIFLAAAAVRLALVRSARFTGDEAGGAGGGGLCGGRVPGRARPSFPRGAPVVGGARLRRGGETPRGGNRRYLKAGLAVGLLLYLPVAIYEARTGLGNSRAFIA